MSRREAALVLAGYTIFTIYEKLPFDVPNKIYICIKYKNRPTIEMVKLLNEISETNYAKQIKTKKGSFIEWIEGNQAIVTALNLLLEFLAITVPIAWDIRKDKQITQNKNAGITITINNNMGKNYIPKNTLDFITNSTASMINSALEKNIGNTINVIVNNNLLDDDDMCGYSSKNIEKINISSNIE